VTATVPVAPPEQPDELERAWATRPGLVGWLGAVNHKQVGRRYLVTALVFFLVGGAEALLMRWQLASAEGGVLAPHEYNAMFTLHGTTMMFLFAVPVVEAFAAYVVPLMIGTRDLPFPRLSAFTYWTYLAGGLLLYSSLLPGALPDGGWFAYVPLTGPEFSPGLGMDFWLLGVTFVEISGILAAVELVVAVLRTRAPGMSLTRMPVFAWSALTAAAMILFAFPPLVVGSVLLELDRKFGTPFYNPDLGGDPLLWQHLFWFFGHPDVYVMLLPALGIISSVIPVFARTRLVGYSLIVVSTVAVGVVSFGLWVHHMFTVGLPVLALSLFAVGSFVIAVPSGLQIFAWIATIWQGRVVWGTPLLYALGFLVLFVFGGISGVMVASAPFDGQAHDTYFVVAHFHYVIVGGVLFPLLAGVYYWWPKLTGRLLSDRLGRTAFWVLFVSFNLTFLPQHIVGLLGMPRRVYTYEAELGWEAYNLLSTIGAVGLTAGFLLTVANLVWSGTRGRVAGDDPWGGATLEWATSSPPAPYNFRTIPLVRDRDPLWAGLPLVEDGAQGSLGAPTEPVRCVVLTSPLEARPDDVVTLPQHSLLPLAATGALLLALVGLLLGALPVAAVGGGLAALVALAWAWSRQDEP
jgi:cytochrome c oxidase subunit I+III